MAQSSLFHPSTRVEINRGHPLAQELIGCWLFNEGGGLYAHNLANHYHVPLTGAPVFIPGNGGMGLKSTTTNSGGILATPTLFQRSDNVSMLWHGRFIGTPTAFCPVLTVSHNNTDTSPFVAYELAVDTDSNQIRWDTDYGGTLQELTDPTTFSQDLDYCFIGTATSGAQKLYRDGLQVATGTATGSLAYGASTELWLQRYGDVDPRNANCITYRSMIWARVLTPSEVRTLTDNPYCFLRSTTPLRVNVATTTVLPSRPTMIGQAIHRAFSY